MIPRLLKDLAPFPSCGVAVLATLSCLVFGVHACLGWTQPGLSVGASALLRGRVHTLLTHAFYHRSPAQLLVNVAALAVLCASLERGVGTVRFLLLFPALAATSGLSYSLLDLLRGGGGGEQSEADGLLPAVLACVALTTAHTRVTKGFLCGISFPAVALPWVLLLAASAAPRSRLPCNLVAVCVGWLRGKGWFSLLHVSEANAGALEGTVAFRALRRMSGVLFIPASAEERRKAILPQINPAPGSYPVQAWAPLPSSNAAGSHQGWPSVAAPPAAPAPSRQNS